MARSNVQIALDLAQLAANLVAQRHRREHPEASDEEIRGVVAAWYASRPQAPYGDAVGIPGTWPRSR